MFSFFSFFLNKVRWKKEKLRKYKAPDGQFIRTDQTYVDRMKMFHCRESSMIPRLFFYYHARPCKHASILIFKGKKHIMLHVFYVLQHTNYTFPVLVIMFISTTRHEPLREWIKLIRRLKQNAYSSFGNS